MWLPQTSTVTNLQLCLSTTNSSNKVWKQKRNITTIQCSDHDQNKAAMTCTCPAQSRFSTPSNLGFTTMPASIHDPPTRSGSSGNRIAIQNTPWDKCDMSILRTLETRAPQLRNGERLGVVRCTSTPLLSFDRWGCSAST